MKKTLQIKKMELSVEKENEEAIAKHKVDLSERLQQLHVEVAELEDKQRLVSLNLSHVRVALGSTILLPTVWSEIGHVIQVW